MTTEPTNLAPQVARQLYYALRKATDEALPGRRMGWRASYDDRARHPLQRSDGAAILENRKTETRRIVKSARANYAIAIDEIYPGTWGRNDWMWGCRFSRTEAPHV